MRWLDRFTLRLRTLFRRERVELELHREFQFHLEEQIADNVARGMTAEEARYTALRRIGSVAQIQEQCREQRGLHLVESTMQDVRYALRSLRKNPAFTAVAVLSLALGVGANTAIFSLIDSLLLNSLPIKDPQQLVFVRTNNVKVGNFMVSRTIHIRDLEQMEAHSTRVDGIGSYDDFSRANIGVDGRSELTPGEFVSGKYFEVLGISAQLGRTLLPADDLQNGNLGAAGWPAMISDGYWHRRLGGDPNIIGHPITVNTIPFVIVGVMPRGFDGLSLEQQPAILMPLVTHNQVVSGSVSAGIARSDEPAGQILARIKPGTAQSTAAAELTVLFRNSELANQNLTMAERNAIEKRFIEFEPAARGSSSLRRQFSDPLLALMTVVALVMLIACANIASLLLAKAGARQKEIAIRLSLGSSRRRIVRQLLTESLILSIFGCVLGIVFAIFARDVTLKLGHGSTAGFAMQWDLRLVLFLAGVCIVNALLFGIVPALRITNVDPNEVLKGSQAAQHSSRLPFGRALVMAQLAISLVLVVGAGLFLGSLRNLYRVDLGFSSENLLMATLDPRLIGANDTRTMTIYKQLLEDVKRLPTVASATLMNNRLFSGRAHLSGARVVGYVPEPGEDLSNSWTLTYGVGPRFFEALRMPLIRGRDFSEADKNGAPPVVVINEAMAKHYFRDKDPIGQKVSFGSGKKTAEIVGLVRNAHYFDVQDEKQETIFTPLLQIQIGEFGSEETLVVRTRRNPAQIADDVRASVHRIDPNLPLFNTTTMSDQVASDLRTPRLMATLSSFFGALALALSAIGLYGVLAYGVTKRTGEIGIRMALGADRNNILRLILGETGQVLLIGIGAGLVLAWAASRLVKSMLYGVTAHDARVYAVAAILLGAVALAAAMLPARRAVRVEPMIALRYE
jgi:predicted permease